MGGTSVAQWTSLSLSEFSKLIDVNEENTEESKLEKAVPDKSVEQKLNLPIEMFHPCLVYHNGAMYIFGSNNNIRSWHFDCVKCVYKEICPLPITPKGRSYGFVNNNQQSVIIVGCKMDSYPYTKSFCIEYNIKTNVWIKHDCNFKHGPGFSACRINDLLIISGGI